MNSVLIKKKITITMPAGMSAANEATTVGGTPAGILMTQPFFSTHAYKWTLMIAHRMPTKIPFAPSHPRSSPRTMLVAPSGTLTATPVASARPAIFALKLYGMRMNHDIKATAAPKIGVVFISRAK